MVRVLCNIKDVQTPLVDVLQVLQKAREDPSNYGTSLTKIARFPCNRWSITYLGEQVLQICFYAKTGRTATAGQTRAMRDLPHPTDLSHKLLLLLPPLPLPRFRSGWWDLQFILFIYREKGFGLLLMRLFISALAYSIHNSSHDFSDSLRKFKSPKKFDITTSHLQELFCNIQQLIQVFLTEHNNLDLNVGSCWFDAGTM